MTKSQLEASILARIAEVRAKVEAFNKEQAEFVAAALRGGK